MKNKLKKIFYSGLFAYIYLIMALTLRTNYTVVAPYDTKSTHDMVQIEGQNLTSNLHSVSVVSLDRITPFGRMIYELNEKLSIEPMSAYLKELTISDKNKRGQLQKVAAFEQALVTAYTMANEHDSNITIDYEFKGIVIDYVSTNFKDIKIGDIITEINDNKFNSYDEMITAFRSMNDLVLRVERNDKNFIVNLLKTKNDLFSFYAKYTIHDANPKYKLPGMELPTGGPSGGMMYTMSLYFNLIGYDQIDEIISGTGTINPDFTIGKIGGLKQKLHASIDKNIKYFILPKSQYEEVKHLSNDIKIYQVSNIKEAIEVIYEIFK